MSRCFMSISECIAAFLLHVFKSEHNHRLFITSSYDAYNVDQFHNIQLFLLLILANMLIMLDFHNISVDNAASMLMFIHD